MFLLTRRSAASDSCAVCIIGMFLFADCPARYPNSRFSLDSDTLLSAIVVISSKHSPILS